MTSLKSMLWVALVLLSVAWRLQAAAVCPITTCSAADPNAQILWLNTSTSSLRLRGPEMTIFPVTPTGQTFESAWARLQLNEVAELNGDCGEFLFIESAFEDGRVARSLNLSTACCSSAIQLGTLPGGVGRDMAVINVTRPEFPDFAMTITISLAHDTVVINRPDTPRILGPYEIKYEPGKPKVDVEIVNWPWIADEEPDAGHGDTWLQFFFWTEAKLDQVGNITGQDFGQSFDLAAKSPLVDIRIDFLQVMTFDGVDIYSPCNEFELQFPPTEAFGPFPGILLMCDEFRQPIVPRYQNLSWDPTLSAIFTPPVSDEPPTNGPSPGKNSSKTTAIAVGVSVACIVLIVAVLALLFVFFPPFRRLVISK